MLFERIPSVDETISLNMSRIYFVKLEFRMANDLFTVKKIVQFMVRINVAVLYGNILIKKKPNQKENPRHDKEEERNLTTD